MVVCCTDGFVRQIASCLLAIALFAFQSFEAPQLFSNEPQTLTEQERQKLGIGPFYSKVIYLHDFPIVASHKVTDDALREAAWIIDKMLGDRSDILRAMAANHVRLTVMAFNEYTTDVPEHSFLDDAKFWDRRARGLGATPSVPVASCAEENLLCYPNDPYPTENILIHEFAHAIHETGMVHVDITFDQRLNTAFEEAKKQELWKGTYAETNRQEYWAEGVQSWFDNNRENDNEHGLINTREEIRKHDPLLTKLLIEVFGDKDWRYTKPLDREESDRSHIRDIYRHPLPQFRWRDEPISDLVEVLIQTSLGDISVELNHKSAPVTTTNFLRYVESGYYNGGKFFRTVTPTNQPNNDIKIEVIQGQASTEHLPNAFPAIPLERTRATGIKHLDGVISMARDEADTAQHDFFICIGDQPELDFKGKRNPDGQGFAAFGKVIDGMEVVRKIQAQPAKDQTILEPVIIERAVRLK